jgi:hypothetical protein
MLFRNNSGKLHTSFHDPIKHFYTQSKIGYFIISANENHLTKYPCFLYILSAVLSSSNI